VKDKGRSIHRRSIHCARPSHREIVIAISRVASPLLFFVRRTGAGLLVFFLCHRNATIKRPENRGFPVLFDNRYQVEIVDADRFFNLQLKIFFFARQTTL
jgi:hypothetical protein